MGSHADQNKQFELIAALKLEYTLSGNPMISIDTKKKELLGNFFRAGKLESKDPILVNDHDFPSAADGKLIPRGILDLIKNLGSIHLNTSHDTSDQAREVRFMVKKRIRMCEFGIVVARRRPCCVPKRHDAVGFM